MKDHIDYIKKSLNIENSNKNIKYKKLLSIHLQSNNTENLKGFISSLEHNVDNTDLLEIIIKIDDDDIPMNILLKNLQKSSKINIKYISTPLLGGFSDLWRSMNDMLIISEKDTYFVWNMNDEMRIPIKGWDSVLKKYVGLFPDDLFRLRTSCFRNRNYSDEWECCYAPETSAITTRKWIDLCGDWNPTLGPDTFNQLVAYYFSYHDRYNKNKEIRDIVINDFMFEGEGASIGLTRKQKVIRMGETIKPWFTLLSHRILTEASRRSQKIKANIYLNKLLSNNNNMPKIIDRSKKIKIIHPISNKPLAEFPYKISRTRIITKNFLRSFQYFMYAGGGKDFRKINKTFKRITSYMYFILLKNKLYKVIYLIRRIAVTYNIITRKKGSFLYYFFYISYNIIKNILIIIFVLPIFIFKVPQYILYDTLALIKSLNKNFYEKVKNYYYKNLYIIFPFKSNTIQDTDCTHFLKKINYKKLCSEIDKNKFIFLNRNIFKNYINIIMVCRFYNIKLTEILENQEILCKQISGVDKILSNKFEEHLLIIESIDKYIKNNFDYNLRNFI